MQYSEYPQRKGSFCLLPISTLSRGNFVSFQFLLKNDPQICCDNNRMLSSDSKLVYSYSKRTLTISSDSFEDMVLSSDVFLILIESCDYCRYVGITNRNTLDEGTVVYKRMLHCIKLGVPLASCTYTIFAY